ncbi:dihydrodiol dehydrogenase [Kyrpidia tusciae DSM 2912]|uniref:Dihydrodiol dehydrogenase n=2 Tax=Kyrpidia TaxID=1129704 RepID=D5WVJ5_KYRT2|nr:hypothetical protein [Kyrpidia tusciae]ADG07538.1 dihydrodiol dehydrogenase [Kyrpidia tusciae DSM 2912]
MQMRAVNDAVESRREEVYEAGDPIEIGNEFALVRIRKINTKHGLRLEITSPKLGYQIRLDPLELECLTWQTHDTFAKLLQHPYGPGKRPF